MPAPRHSQGQNLANLTLRRLSTDYANAFESLGEGQASSVNNHALSADVLVKRGRFISLGNLERVFAANGVPIPQLEQRTWSIYQPGQGPRYLRYSKPHGHHGFGILLAQIAEDRVLIRVVKRMPITNDLYSDSRGEQVSRGDLYFGTFGITDTLRQISFDGLVFLKMCHACSSLCSESRHYPVLYLRTNLEPDI